MSAEEFGKFDEGQVITKHDLGLFLLGLELKRSITPRWKVWEHVKIKWEASIIESVYDWLVSGKKTFRLRVAVKEGEPK